MSGARKDDETAAAPMDEIDRKLLELLQKDATLSIAQLAERITQIL